MDDTHREILHQNWDILRRHLEPDSLLPKLTTILTRIDIEEIKQVQEDTRLAKADKLLEVLPKRGPNAFDTFIEALRKVNQSFLADHLIAKTDGPCSRCQELVEELYVVRGERDSVKEDKENLDKEVLEMRKRINDMIEQEQEIRTVLKEVTEESKKQDREIKDLQLENIKLKEMINQKITEIGGITELLATGQATLKKITEQLGETKKNLSCEKEKVKEDTGELEAVIKEERDPVEPSDRLESEHGNQDTYTEEERQLQWNTQRRVSTVHLRHPRKYDTDDGS